MKVKWDKPDCLKPAAQAALETALSDFETKVKLLVGADAVTWRPGSYILFVREYEVELGWERYFFCSPWIAPSGQRQVVSLPQDDVLTTGACYYDYGPGQGTSV